MAGAKTAGGVLTADSDRTAPVKIRGAQSEEIYPPGFEMALAALEEYGQAHHPDLQKAQSKAGNLVSMIPFVRAYRDQVIVMKMGGSLMDEAVAVESLVRDSVCFETLRMRPVVVHGGGLAISAALDKLGEETRFLRGYRVTSEGQVDVINRVLSGITHDLAARVGALGGQARVFCGADIFVCRQMSPDLDRVGEIIGMRTEEVSRCFERGEIPIISPTARDEHGRLYNCNADDAAAFVAVALAAKRLIFMTDQPGILTDLNDKTSLISDVTYDEVLGLIANGTIGEKLRPKVSSAFAALDGGVSRVSFVDGGVKDMALVEVLTPTGAGTMIIGRTRAGER